MTEVVIKSKNDSEVTVDAELYKYSKLFKWNLSKSNLVLRSAVTLTAITIIFLFYEGICFYLYSRKPCIDGIYVLSRDDIIKLFPVSVVALGFAFTFYQFRHKYINDKKHNTLLFIEKAIKDNAEKRHALNDLVNFMQIQLETNNSPLKLKRIHNWICTKKTAKNYLSNKKCKITKKGLTVRSYLFDLMNIYELIGLGIVTHTLDEEMTQEYFKGIIKTNYIYLEEYILHTRKKHNNTTFGTYFQWLYQLWVK